MFFDITGLHPELDHEFYVEAAGKKAASVLPVPERLSASLSTICTRTTNAIAFPITAYVPPLWSGIPTDSCFPGQKFIHKGELYMTACSTEYADLLIGKSTDGGKTHPIMVMSTPEDSDLLDANNWSFSELVEYDLNRKGVAKSPIEGSLVILDGELYNIMRTVSDPRMIRLTD